MADQISFIKLFILEKLYDLGKIGGAHTAEANLQKGLSMSIRANKKGQKDIQQAIKELINEGFLLSYPSTNEQHVSLNPRKIKELKELLKS